jgi:hypothetical protein
VGIHARVAKERDEVLQDLGDATAVCGRIDVEHAAARDGGGEPAQLGHTLRADDLRVIRDPPRRGDRDLVRG